MKLVRFIIIFSLTLLVGSVWAGSDALKNYKTLTMLDGDWVLSPAEVPEGGTNNKGPAVELVGTDRTAISFKVVGKGSAVQENLLPGTGKEMVTMYHCDKVKACSQVQAKHYCAKQNQPELIEVGSKPQQHWHNTSKQCCPQTHGFHGANACPHTALVAYKCQSINRFGLPTA